MGSKRQNRISDLDLCNWTMKKLVGCCQLRTRRDGSNIVEANFRTDIAQDTLLATLESRWVRKVDVQYIVHDAILRDRERRGPQMTAGQLAQSVLDDLGRGV